MPGAGGKFAGYLLVGSVHSISARWRVPALAPASRLGLASTWIGAEAPGSRAAPFIQIGTQEEVHPPLKTGQAPVRYLEAFWSDTALGFHPHALLALDTGDQISANMRLLDGRWRLQIVDLTNGGEQTVITSQEGGGAFNYGLWLQEDVTDLKNNRPAPYPDVGPVHISGLSLDGTAPRAGSMISTWMQLPGGYLGPTPLRQGAFSILPQRISAPAARYLEVAEPQDQASTLFARQSADWRATTPPTVMRHELEVFLAALRTNIGRLRNGSWPANVRSLIDRLANGYASQLPVFRRAVGGGGGGRAGLAGAEAQLSPSARVGALEAREIRQRLGVEEMYY